MKRIALAVILLLLAFPSLNASANPLETNFSLSGFSCGEPVISDDVTAYFEEFKSKEANMVEKFIVEQSEAAWQIGDINTMNTLIFGNPYCIWAGEGASMASNGVFTAEQNDKVIEPMQMMFSNVYFTLMTLALMIAGVKLSFGGISGRSISMFWEDTGQIIGSFVFVLLYPLILDMLFLLNSAIVLSVRDLVSGSGISLIQSSLMNDGTNPISFVIITLAEWILSLILNFIYMARVFILALLMILGYVAAYSLMFPKTRGFFGVWFRELIGNIFVQSIHAIVFFVMIQFAASGAGLFFKMGMLIMFIPVTGLISKFLNFGDSSSSVGNMVAMTGLGGIASSMMLLRPAANILSGGSMYGSNSSYGSSSSYNSTMANGGNMSELANAVQNDSLKTAISTDASGTNSSMWNTSKSAVSYVAGGMGAVAGLVAGPMGSVIGYKVTSTASNLLMQGGRNMAMGGVNAFSQFTNAKNFTDANGNSGFKAMMNDSSARRQFFGNVGESVGSMVGLGKVGRSVGFAASGVSRQALMQDVAKNFNLTDANGNLLPATFQNLSAQYPGADVKFVQTNMGSGFYVNREGEWQQIGASGAGDTGLQHGEMRMVDYKLADHMSNDYALQPNGTYTAKPLAEGMNNPSIQNVAGVLSASSTPPNATGIENGTAAFQSNPMMNGPVPTGVPQSQPSSNSAAFEQIIANGNSPLNNSVPIVGTQSQPTGNSASFEQVVANGHSSLNSGTHTTGSDASRTVENPSLSRVNVGQSSSESLGSVNSSLEQAAASVQMNTGTSANINGSNAQSIGPMPTLSESPTSQDMRQNSSQSSRPELSGLQGSTPHLMRQSDAYIVSPPTTGVNGTPTPAAYSATSGHITSASINQATQAGTQNYADSNFKPAAINPDAYVYHNASNQPTRTGSDRAADLVHTSTNKLSQTWARKSVQQKQEKRHRKVY